MAKQTIRKIDPFTGKAITALTAASPAEIRETVARARGAQSDWAALPVRSRVKLVERAAQRIGEAVEELAPLITRETGKPVREARAEVAAAERRIRHVNARARGSLGQGPRIRDERCWGAVAREPLGVVGVITAWNYPVSVPSQVIASALLAGNTVVFKPSELVPLSGRRLAEIWREVLPGGVLVDVAGADEAGRALVRSDIDMVAFVGSAAVGRAIMAASAPRLHRLALELGGKDPAIICHDADLGRAARRMIGGALYNCGQECNSVERIYVDRGVEGDFLRLLVVEVRRLRVGDPMREETDIGPMISARQRHVVEEHVRDAVRRGARALLGGRRRARPRRGFFYPPTILTGVDHSMRVMREETFGPVIPVMAFDSEEQAVALANDTEYGLTASVWSRDIARAQRLARQLVAGIRAVNGTGAAHPLFPWGGAKQSGLGRLMGPDPFADFTDQRSVIVYQ
jgi:acyl-CoA reductase-like NAD-dependent aldehyde dehydrogenase